MRPVSSRASRIVASRSVSPHSSTPPGSDHSPRSGGWPRRINRTRLSRTMTAPTPTSGLSGYSRLMRNAVYRDFEARGSQLEAGFRIARRSTILYNTHYVPGRIQTETMLRLLLDFRRWLGRFLEAPFPFVFVQGHSAYCRE